MTNKQLIGVVIVVILLVGGGFLISKSSKNVSENTTPPTPTPIPNPTDTGRVAAGYVSGQVSIGPSCGGPEQAGHPCVTPPSAYTSREAVVYALDGSVEERVHLDAEGNYKIALGPGNYFVQIVPAGIGAGVKKPVTIKSFETSFVNFDIDTGMR